MTTEAAKLTPYQMVKAYHAAQSAKARAAKKGWKCNECGKLMSLKQAEKASFSVEGCPKCGGSDIDLA